MGLEQLPKDHALELALLEAYQDAFRSLKRAWDCLPDDRRIGLIPPPTEGQEAPSSPPTSAGTAESTRSTR